MTYPPIGDNPDSGLPPRSISNIPVPDPSTRTNETIAIEIKHLRELMEAAQNQTSKHLDAADAQADARFRLQLKDVRRQVEAKFLEQDRAVQAALTSADKAIQELNISIGQRLAALQELNQAQFITYRTLLDAQTEKVKIAVDADNKLTSAAFAASKEAIRAAFDSSKEAITKAETFNEKRFELMYKQIDEIRTQQALNAGKGLGAAGLWSFAVGGIGLIATIIAIMLAFSRGVGG